MRCFIVAAALLISACAEHSSSEVPAPAGGSGFVESGSMQFVKLGTRGPHPTFSRSKLQGVRDVTSFAWAVPVSNRSSDLQEVTLTVRFVDRYGVAIHTLTRSAKIAPRTTHRFAGEWLALPTESFRVVAMETSAGLPHGQVVASHHVPELWPGTAVNR